MDYKAGYKEYNDAVKHRKYGEVTIYNFDDEVYYNVPEWTRSRFDEAEAESSANISGGIRR